MHAIALWLALAAAPFWEAKPPQDWSEEQLQRILTDSPWAQTVAGSAMFLATAEPMRDAERERWRRRTAKGAEPPDPEYTDFLAKEASRHIILAIGYRNLRALDDAAEARRIGEESILKVGKKKYKITGQFPPTPSDPYLRLVYPREIGPNEKSLVFELYLPGTSGSYQMLDFRMKELVYHGKPEM